MFNKEDKEFKSQEKILTKAVMASVVEQRRARRMRFLMFILALLYLPFILLVLPSLLSPQSSVLGKASKSHIAVVNINGIISTSTQNNADYIIRGIKAAMKSDNSKALILRINSQGGSPVQSDMVYQEILRQRRLNPDKPIYAVIEDIGASGAYYIAAASERIYAAKASVVGSIGVTSGGSFGMVDALKKLGVERRVYTSGENKAFLDPFLPENPAHKQRYQQMLKNVHQQFIDAVENQRISKFKQDSDLYNGYVWTGDESLKLGLIDSIGTIDTVSREVIGIEDMVDYTVQIDFFSKFAGKVGAAIAQTTLQSLSFEPSIK